MIIHKETVKNSYPRTRPETRDHRRKAKLLEEVSRTQPAIVEHQRKVKRRGFRFDEEKAGELNFSDERPANLRDTQE
jgi:hypothetical protein